MCRQIHIDTYVLHPLLRVLLQDPTDVESPTIFYYKQLLKSYADTDQLLLFCDLHGADINII